MHADDLPVTAAPGDPSPPPGLVVVGRFDEGEGYRVDRPAGSDSWLFVWTTDGSGRLRQGGAEARSAAGQLTVLAPGVAHTYAVDPGARRWVFWWAHCQARPSWTPWLRACETGDGLHVAGPVPEALHERVEGAWRRMFADARWPGAPDPAGGTGIVVAEGSAARELALCALEEVLVLATASARVRAPQAGLDDRVRRAQARMAADPGAPHTVRSLAGELALSPSRFAHLFTERTGQSPMRALREIRLRHAARLLEATDLPVERVARACGFVSAFHFSRVFRARYGSPPGAYRDGMRTGIPPRKAVSERVPNGTPIP